MTIRRTPPHPRFAPFSTSELGRFTPFSLTGPHRFASVLTALILLFAVTGCVTEKDDPAPTSLRPGDRMPRFSIVMDDGSTLTSASLSGKVAVIVLFNTSCPDCQAELPVVQAVSDEFGDDAGVRFLCIARAESAGSIADFWRDRGLTLPYSAQPDAQVYSLFASSVIPRIYIFDTAGILTAQFSDSPLPTAATLTTAIRSTLHSTAAIRSTLTPTI